MQPNPYHVSKLKVFFTSLLGFAVLYVFLYWGVGILGFCLLNLDGSLHPDFLYRAVDYSVSVLPYVPAVLACLSRHRRNFTFVGGALAGCIVGTLINSFILNTFFDLSVG